MSSTAKILKIKSEVASLELLIDEMIEKTKNAIDKAKNGGIFASKEEIDLISDQYDFIHEKNEQVLTECVNEIENHIKTEKTQVIIDHNSSEGFFDVSNNIGHHSDINVDNYESKISLDKEKPFLEINDRVVNEFNEEDSIIENTRLDYQQFDTSHVIEESEELSVKVVFNNGEEKLFNLKNKKEIQKMFDNRMNKQVNLKQIDKVSKNNTLIKPNKNVIYRLKNIVNNVLNLFKKKNKKR